MAASTLSPPRPDGCADGFARVTGRWNTTTASCASSYLHRFASQWTAFPTGADRQAALALPLALLPPDDTPATEADEHPAEAAAAETTYEAALTAGTTSLYNEVRENAAEGLRRLRGRPCDKLSDGRCWHELIWRVIESGARNVVVGPMDEQGRRNPETLAGDLITGLRDRPDRDLMLTQISPTAICALEAASDATCITERAVLLRDALLDAYVRAAGHWADSNYEFRD